jgi:hypothetical protein
MRPTTLVGFLLSACLAAPGAWGQALKAPADFAGISDPAERSRALFAEAGKVIESPRCQNCHPVGERPTQGDDMQPHLPLVVRGQDGHGAIAMRCATCHQVANFQPAGVPGAPKWHIAPVEMAWQGKSLGAICEQIKDPARNGKRTLAQIHDHMAHDALVGWGWHPGGARSPAPGTQAQFGALIDAWIKTGAACPAS